MQSHSLLLAAPGRLTWAEDELPELRAADVLVRTTRGAVSVGSELALYRGRLAAGAHVFYPRMTGYESAGVVVACGDSAPEGMLGSRVVGFYGHRDYAVIPAARAVKIPDDVANELALLLILSSDVANGVARAQIVEGESALVTGAGEIGLLCVFNLKARGVKRVDVVEPDPARRATALSFGASRAVAPEGAGQLEDAYQVGFECSDADAAFHLLQERLAEKGRLCVLSDGNYEPLTLTDDFHRKQLAVLGSSDEDNYGEHARWFYEQLRGGWAARLRALYQFECRFEDLGRFFADADKGSLRPLKALVLYDA